MTADSDDIRTLHAGGASIRTIAARLGITEWAARKAILALGSVRPERQARTAIVQFRATEEERAAIEAAGGGPWVRDLVLAALRG